MNKKLRKLALTFVVGVLAMVGVYNANAQFTVTITFDENGNGTFMNSAGFNSPLPATVGQDPGPGGLANALTYGLLNPPGLTAGDLLLFEPGVGGVLSDVIRFNPSQNGGSLVFYSDISDGADSVADIGFPTTFYPIILNAVEVGPEGNNGYTYTPVLGQPGYVTGAGGPVTYVIISDVPEPTTLALAGLGGLAALVAARRRK